MINNKRFDLFVDLGIIIVPDNYMHGKQLSSINLKKFDEFNSDITDKNFPNPTRIMKPGDKFHVLVYKQIVSGSTTSEERMEFLKKQNAVFTGAQGASIVYEQKRDQLPKGYRYLSYDKKESLCKITNNEHGIPCLGVYPDICSILNTVFLFNIKSFESGGGADDFLLCFCA